MRFAFISKYPPTQKEINKAAEHKIELIFVQRDNWFTITPVDLACEGEFDGVVTVHQGAALRLIEHYDVGVFETLDISYEKELGHFRPVNLHIYRRRA